jgi:hypothetical protein
MCFAVVLPYCCCLAHRDGVIEAKIDHENGWLSSNEVLDLYSTEEPQKAFHKYVRITPVNYLSTLFLLKLDCSFAFPSIGV